MSCNRRNFIKGGVSLASVGAASWLTNLAALSQSFAQESNAGESDDYKALVCIFLLGGNDHYNTLIPIDPGFKRVYAEARPTFYIKPDQLAYGDGNSIVEVPRPLTGGFSPLLAADKMVLNCSVNIYGSGKYALAPSLSSLHQLYLDKVLAPVLNVGPLEEPTVGVLENGAVKLMKPSAVLNLPTDSPAVLPPQLGSHNDQQMYWQALGAEGARSGWGGRLLEYSAVQNNGHDFDSISTSGGFVWGEGVENSQYLVGMATRLAPFLSIPSDLLVVTEAVMTGAGVPWALNTEHPLAQDLKRIAQESSRMRSEIEMAAANFSEDEKNNTYPELFSLLDPPGANNPGDKNNLANQLLSVAHGIRVCQSMPDGPKRQVFFVTLGGFDTHSTTKGEHDRLLQHLGQGMFAFYQALKRMGMQNQVTTFTASEFGRTLSGNGDGSDHGWAGHQFVMGGAVNGGVIHGTPNQLGDKAPSWGTRAANAGKVDDIGRGRVIPTISVTQYGATLAKWMGVPDDQLSQVFGNIDNFGTNANWPRALNFMK